MPSPKTVAVVGASADRSKFGNKAVRAFRDSGWTVFPIHPVLEHVEGLPAYRDLDAIPLPALDQVSFYVPPAVGLGILDQVQRKTVGEIWLNPGSESPEILARAEKLGLNVIQACSILARGVIRVRINPVFLPVGRQSHKNLPPAAPSFDRKPTRTEKPTSNFSLFRPPHRNCNNASLL